MKNLIEVIDLHEKMKKSYFWSSPSISQQRRAYEDNNSKVTCFEYLDDVYNIKQTTICSCKNIYYKMKIYKNNDLTKLNIRFVKKILKEVDKNETM